MDWDMYQLHRTMMAHPSYLLHDTSGRLVRLVNQTVFDFTQPAVQELWLDVLRNASRSGVIDGAFLVICCLREIYIELRDTAVFCSKIPTPP